ncbi:VTT domain-containing protein [Flavobacterium sp. NRK F10]|uniref:Alkaline phosphatase n=1 Tax=Flavobacterium sediminis TaxID=2201181 RepID=A0A2U8QSV2_9FLAO|nr:MULTISPECIES: VTT domain-containing protein [Flavobacterium]AWM13242.1 alkaline phosphatase [Flavobacterium sediminis]MCO6174419.1 VTT domain-containing protein [Flavobacterium sp. NRK F10]
MEDFHWTKLFNPEFYITMEIGGVPVGIYMVLFIVFAETGLFAGFFLPGDSLLFLSGIYSRELVETFFYIPGDFSNVTILGLLIAAAATLGNIFGYWFGARSGQFLYQREDSFFFKKRYLHESQIFFERHGGKAIIFARFLPIIRTFVPIIAGIVHMKKTRFMFYNVLSSVMWSFILVFAGHYLYGLFLEEFDLDLKKHIEKIIFILIAVTTFPLVMKAIKSAKNKSKKE